MLPDEFVVSEERLEAVFDAAGHVDEGTVHAWLDGAFDAETAARVAQHVNACTACGALVAEARGLVAASHRILGGLDSEPAGVVPAADAARTAARIAAPPQRRWFSQPWALRAAALILVVGGGAVVLRPRGAVTDAGVQSAPVAAAPAPSAPVETLAVASSPASPPAASPSNAPTGSLEATPSVATSPVSEAAAPPSIPTPTAPEQARARVADIAAAAVSASTAADESARSVAGSEATAAAPVVRSASNVSNGDAAAAPVVVTGTVRDVETRQPIANANVMLLRDATLASSIASGQTNATGGFALTVPAAPRNSTVYINVRWIGYNRVQQPVLLRGDTVRVELLMQRGTMALSSIVVMDAGAEALSRKRAGTSAMPARASIASTPAPAPAAGVGVGRNMNEMSRRDPAPLSREQYDRIEDNPFLGVKNNPLSTFSIDVDRASYTNVRRYLTGGTRPPNDAVRIEEFINYFPYSLPSPRGNDPVSISSDVIAAPWQPKHKLVRVALQAKRIETTNLPPNNLVFLLDVSGSMDEWNKLPLVKQALRLLVDQLRPQDRVAIVAYAGAAGLVLPSTSGDEKVRILDALERLQAGGSTAGGAGIELAYKTARDAFLPNGNNRVILATDGDFNVGPSSDGELERLVEQRRREGTYLTVLGFGTGNYQASKMEKLAKVGNGNAAYVDNLSEARKVLVEEMGATLLTVANDVKLQVEFNPAAVQAYRLIGYENRLLATEDFNDDAKDAGDIGAGHQVTALYEVVPVGVQGTVSIRGMDSLRYVAPDRGMTTNTSGRDELLFVKLRYKTPGQSSSRLMSHAVSARVNDRPGVDTRFVAAVASFGMLLRDSEYKGNSSAAQVLEQARAALGDDVGGYRAEFVQLVERWRALAVRAGERR